MQPNRPKSKRKSYGNLFALFLGPVFRLRMPDFKGMNEMYKKKLKGLGYPGEEEDVSRY